MTGQIKTLRVSGERTRLPWCLSGSDLRPPAATNFPWVHVAANSCYSQCVANEHDHIDKAPHDAVNARFAAVDSLDVITLVPQHAAQRAPHARLVVDDQDRCFVHNFFVSQHRNTEPQSKISFLLLKKEFSVPLCLCVEAEKFSMAARL